MSFTLKEFNQLMVESKTRQVSAHNAPQTTNAFHNLLDQQAQLCGLPSRPPQQENKPMSPAVRAILEATRKRVPVNFATPEMAAALAAARPGQPTP